MMIKSLLTKLRPKASASQQVPNEQSQSQLYNLPLEIRHQIYGHILDSYGTAQHIVLSQKNLTHLRCVASDSQLFFQMMGPRNGMCDPYDTEYHENEHEKWEMIDFLLSCRLA